MTLHAFSAQRSLFKAYDIRGERQLFTAEFSKALSNTLAQAFLKQAAATQVVIGFDARHGSEFIAKQLASSFQAYGIEVVWLGLVTTPIMAYWANQYQGHGLIATASHSEPHINGIKWLINGESPSTEQIQALYQQLIHSYGHMNDGDNSSLATLDSNAQTNPLACQVTLSSQVIADGYIHKACEALNAINHAYSPTFSQTHQKASKFKIVIDCLNGATGPFAEQFYRTPSNLCYDVILLNAEPNGDFPKGNPDPMEDNRLQELSEAVVHHKADLGLSFDGDGDRLMVIDNNGTALVADHLLYLLSRVAVEDHLAGQRFDTSKCDAPTIIFDVKCSHHLPFLVAKTGAQGEMSRTGSSILRRTLHAKKQQTHSKALFAGELSGHFIFNDGHFILYDDAMYAGLRLLNWLQRQPASLAQIIASLPHMVSTPDVYLPLAEHSFNPTHDHSSSTEDSSNSQPILQKLSALCHSLQNSLKALPISLPADTRLTCIDGIRLDFTHGFGIIRSSNTSNSLTVRFAGDSLADLQQIQKYFVTLCQSISQDLANQVANIQVKQ